MIQRFQIEDLVSQDVSGVVFRALDSESEAVVSVRRLFPFGPDGGGLKEDEQTAYNIAVSRLLGIQHASLRSVICGGCDPIDGMPFIATEWVEGKPLQFYLERKPVTPTEAIQILTQALELCELLSGVLAEEGVWVETDAQTIIVGEEGTGRGVTFWVSPLRWLNRKEDAAGLDPIVLLTEKMMGWQGQNVGDQAGRGLGAWLKWLRANSKTVSLKEARDALAASTGMEPPTPSKQLVRQASRPPVPIRKVKKKKKKAINGMVVTIVLLCIVAGGLVAWAMHRKDEPVSSGGLAELAAKIAKEQADGKPAEKQEPLAADNGLSADMRELAAAVNKEPEPEPAPEREKPAESKKEEPKKKKPAAPAAKAEPSDSTKQVFSPADPKISEQEGNETSVEGTVKSIQTSASGKTIYLVFSDDGKSLDACGAIILSRGGPELSAEALAPVVGKKVRISGKLVMQSRGNARRPEITIDQRSDIVAAE